MPGVSLVGARISFCKGTSSTKERWMVITGGNLWFEAGGALNLCVISGVCVTLALCACVKWRQQL